MSRTRISFPCGDLTLEGVVSIPAGADRLPAVVVCHPHPLRGGDMYNSVVLEVCRELEAKGIVSLRFNFRGTGGSSGQHDQGIGEQEDVLAALAYLAGLPEIDRDRLGVAGYSFGAGVGTRVGALENGVKAFAAVSLPLRMAEVDELQRCAKPKFFISGSEDGFIPAAELQTLVESLPEPRQCIIVSGADHFWYDEAEEAAREIASFFSKNL